MTSTAAGAAPSVPVEQIEIGIGGMTCASCAARIEKKLNRLDGVQATVNYATEHARVSFPNVVGREPLVATVEKASHTATLPRARANDAGPADRRPGEGESGGAATSVAGSGDAHQAPDGQAPDGKAPDDPAAALRQRLMVSLALSVPVVVLAMVPAGQFPYWQWLSWCGGAGRGVGAWPFHTAAWTNLRHGAATMDTLISLGTLAALGWSRYALFLGTAGMTPTPSKTPHSRGRTHQ